MNTTIHVRASQPQHTPAGRLLGKMYYGGFIDVLKRDESSGYPHNGGEHSLSLYMTPPNLSSFLSLVADTFPNHEGTEPFIASVKANVAQRYPALQLA